MLAVALVTLSLVFVSNGLKDTSNVPGKWTVILQVTKRIYQVRGYNDDVTDEVIII